MRGFTVNKICIMTTFLFRVKTKQPKFVQIAVKTVFTPIKPPLQRLERNNITKDLIHDR